LTLGELLLAGEAGVVPLTTGAAGGAVSIVHDKSDVLLAPVIRTENEWVPPARPVYVFGLVQLVNDPESSLHSVVVVPPPWTVHVNVAEVLFVGLDGPDRLWTFASVKLIDTVSPAAPVAVTL
jgi:hypothetical protein